MKVAQRFLLVSLLLLASPLMAADNPAADKSRAVTAGLHHLGLTVSRLGSSVKFFTEVLGWTVKGGDPSYPMKVVSDGKITLTLWQVEDIEGHQAFDRKNNIGLHHLALSVDSVEALDVLYRRLLIAPGVTIEFAPEFNRGGPTRHMMIREPGGNRVEFTVSP